MVKKFSEEYKLEAVQMVLETGISASQVVKDLGIGRSTLEKWVRE
jgi:transposase